MNTPLPRETTGDDVHRAARAALSAIPFVGGAAMELFNRVIVPPVQRRREAWLNDLAERVSALEREGRVKVEDLQNNDQFVSTVMQATEVAVRNHQQEKIDALRNAVLNTALGQSPEDAKRDMFLGFVDMFSVPHLRILKAMAAYDADGRHSVTATSIGSLTQLALAQLPDLIRSGKLVEVAVEDLCRRGLLFWNSEGGVLMIPEGATQVSDFGREFLRFISEPKEGKT